MESHGKCEEEKKKMQWKIDDLVLENREKDVLAAQLRKEILDLKVRLEQFRHD